MGLCIAHTEQYREGKQLTPLGPKLTRAQSISDIREMILDRCNLTANGCYEYLNVDDAGYGHIMFEGKSWFTHRLMYSITKGLPLPGMVIRHGGGCDNPPCCNPEHLFVGTIPENNMDYRYRGTEHRKGTVGRP